MPSPHVIAIMGPTASGKSAVAELLADALDARIVNADAFQVYKGFDIGTAKPRHRDSYDLIDIRSPNEPYSAGQFVREAEGLIRSYQEVGRHTIVCGGTGLYARALWEGYDDMPPPDAALRSQLWDDLNNLGMEEILRREGISGDELSHDLRKNQRRLLRFLEKRRIPGKPPDRTPWLTDQPKFAIALDRTRLVERIRTRIDRMVSNGWLDEVASLLESGVSKESQPFRAIGYGTMAAVVEGEITLDEAIEKIFVATRQYAKRQVTWLRKEPRLLWVDGNGGAEAAASEILNIIRGGSNGKSN